MGSAADHMTSRETANLGLVVLLYGAVLGFLWGAV